MPGVQRHRHRPTLQQHGGEPVHDTRTERQVENNALFRVGFRLFDYNFDVARCILALCSLFVYACIRTAEQPQQKAAKVDPTARVPEQPKPAVSNTGAWKTVRKQNSFTDQKYVGLHLPPDGQPLDDLTGTSTFLEVIRDKSRRYSTSVFLSPPARIRLFEPDQTFLHVRFDGEKATMITGRAIRNGQIVELPKVFVQSYRKHQSLLIGYTSVSNDSIEHRFNLSGIEHAMKMLEE